MTMARSAAISLPAPTSTGVHSPPAFTSLVNLADNKTLPRTLRVRSRLTLGAQNDLYSAAVAQQLTCGCWWNTEAGMPSPWDGGGALRIRCGTREVYADLREGEFNLPPCADVDVAVAWWNPTDTGSRDDGLWAVPLEVTAEIVDGPSIEATPLCVTASRRQTNYAGMSSVLAPPGAYAFDLVGGFETLPVGLTITGGPTHAVRDWTTGRWLPPTTPLLLRGERVAIMTADSVPLEQQSAFGFLITVCFFIR
jgi:hypothetical protein